mmetsp:Transcript_14670/g.32388  ORF Transcript_14670/g.32388 Transcript_14670/m.32388 type:complete len:202 (-) Transcript_14670:235-840(-)
MIFSLLCASGGRLFIRRLVLSRSTEARFCGSFSKNRRESVVMQPRQCWSNMGHKFCSTASRVSNFRQMSSFNRVADGRKNPRFCKPSTNFSDVKESLPSQAWSMARKTSNGPFFTRVHHALKALRIAALSLSTASNFKLGVEGPASSCQSRITSPEKWRVTRAPQKSSNFTSSLSKSRRHATPADPPPISRRFSKNRVASG